MSIPNSISYRNVKPLGIPSRIRKVKYIPQNIYGDIKPNDIVRFHIKAPTFWDPYNAFVRLKVDFSGAHDDCVQQIDSSAQSFISEMRISAGNTEIENIQEYDVLASMLLDNTYNIDERNGKSNEGLSGENFPTLAFSHARRDCAPKRYMMGKENIAVAGSEIAVNVINYMEGSISHGYKPTLSSPFYHGVKHFQINAEHVLQEQVNTDHTVNCHLDGDLTNPINCIDRFIATKNKIYDRCISRADKAFVMQKKKGHPGPFNKLYKYPFNHSEEIPNKFYNSNENMFPDEPIVGVANLFSNDFSGFAFEDCFSNKTTEWSFKNGQVGKPEAIARNQGEYIFPLLSGVLGVLMPKENYKLFPAFALDNLVIEFRINPHAVFTSGYEDNYSYSNVSYPYVDDAYLSNGHWDPHADNPPVDQSKKLYETRYTNPQTNQFQRSFKITEMEILVDLIQFDETIGEMMKSQLSGDGIVLATHSFALGPLFNLQRTESLGQYLINSGFESLKSIYMMYLSNDYLQYSFCRKNYRLSGNVTSLHAQLGLDSYPEKPIEGHGGNSVSLSKDDKTNWPYVYELIRIFGHLNEAVSHSVINRYNFAINERPYDVTDTSPYILSNNRLVENNNNTAMGYPLIHENRIIGKAVYVLNFAYNADSTMFNGINTIALRPFDILVKSDSKTVNPDRDRPRTLLFFMHYDMIVQISLGSVRVLGRQ